MSTDFNEWFNELEGFHIKSERFYESLTAFSNDALAISMVKWLEAAFEAGAAAEREAVLDLVDDYAKGNTDLQAAIRARGDR